MDLRTLTIMGFLCKVYVHLTLNGYQRLPIQITEFVNNHYIGWNLNISGITPNPKFMGFALMGAMPSMIMRCLGGPLWSLNLPALGRGILLAVFKCESPLSSKPKPWCLLSEEDIGMSRHVFQETAMGKWIIKIKRISSAHFLKHGSHI